MEVFLLDTNILLGYIRASSYAAYVEKKFQLFNPINISVISVVSIGEIKSLAYQFGWREKKLTAVQELIKKIPVINIDLELIPNAFAEIDAFSQGKHSTLKLNDGMSARNMGKNDLWVAATANIIKATLLSTDKHFEHLNGTFIDFIYIDQSLTENDA